MNYSVTYSFLSNFNELNVPFSIFLKLLLFKILHNKATNTLEINLLKN